MRPCLSGLAAQAPVAKRSVSQLSFWKLTDVPLRRTVGLLTRPVAAMRAAWEAASAEVASARLAPSTMQE